MISLFEGILLGLGAAVPIGPVNVEIARRTLAGGFLAGAALGCGAVTVDVTYAALTTFSVTPLLDHHGVRLPLLIGGTAVLAYLGIMCLVSARKATRQEFAAQASTTSVRRGYITGLLMTALNPMTLAFWLVAVPSAGARSPGTSLPILCLGVFLGTIVWVIGFSASMAYARRFRQGWWAAAADIAGGIILLAFAVFGAFAAFHNPGILR